MKKVFIGLLLSFNIIFAGQVPSGSWSATSSNAGDCPTCKIKITKITPHIISIVSNNGWVGYAYYNSSTDSYKGASEWKSGQGGSYENVIFLLDIVYENRTLTIKGKTTKGTIISTYRKTN